MTLFRCTRHQTGVGLRHCSRSLRVRVRILHSAGLALEEVVEDLVRGLLDQILREAKHRFTDHERSVSSRPAHAAKNACETVGDVYFDVIEADGEHAVRSRASYLLGC